MVHHACKPFVDIVCIAQSTEMASVRFTLSSNVSMRHRGQLRLRVCIARTQQLRLYTNSQGVTTSYTHTHIHIHSKSSIPTACLAHTHTHTNTCTHVHRQIYIHYTHKTHTHTPAVTCHKGPGQEYLTAAAPLRHP